jgi:Polyketide cyclase / dehydrase and lipid transport
MGANDYHFVTRWRFRADIREVADILDDVESLPRWWPSVYLDVKVLEPGDPSTGVGKTVELFTKGWLPYTLRWRFRVVDRRPPKGFALEASGDFDGRGVWTLEQQGETADVTYDWRIRADKPLLRWLSFLMKPLFSANHEWAMARGEESLRLELSRRRATSDAERARVPAPPPPTFRRARSHLHSNA